jgi:N-acetylmuramic acid 6-phosphate etherase
MAGGRAAVFASREGTEDRADRGRAEARRLRRGDALVGISASGTTAFVRGALTAARARGVATVLVTCAPRRSVGRADVVIAVASGPEVLTGSSRLKAGSATKAVLNALTTAAMVRLGKVYGNLMVDLHAGSAKLRDRRRRIVAAAAQVDEETASRLLRDAKGDVKTAVVAGRLGLPARDARRRLVLAGGRVRRALER